MVDAEGAAMEVLQGASAILRRDRPEVESRLLSSYTKVYSVIYDSR